MACGNKPIFSTYSPSTCSASDAVCQLIYAAFRRKAANRIQQFSGTHFHIPTPRTGAFGRLPTAHN